MSPDTQMAPKVAITFVLRSSWILLLVETNLSRWLPGDRSTEQEMLGLTDGYHGNGLHKLFTSSHTKGIIT